MELCIEFEIVDPKLISVNDQYLHPVRKCKDGRYRSYFCPSESLKEFKLFFKEVLGDKILDDQINKISEYLKETSCSGLELFLVIGFPSSEVYEHDASNFVKSIEDSITVRTGIDDSKNLRVVVEKRLSSDSHTYLAVRVRPYLLRDYVNLSELNSEEVFS